MSYPRLRLGCQCELFVVCVYVVLLFTSTPDVLSTCLLLTLSMLVQAHHKETFYSLFLCIHHARTNTKIEYTKSPIASGVIQSPYGGPGRYCPAVQNPFGVASYSNNLHCIFIWLHCQLKQGNVIINNFWMLYSSFPPYQYSCSFGRPIFDFFDQQI